MLIFKTWHQKSSSDSDNVLESLGDALPSDAQRDIVIISSEESEEEDSKFVDPLDSDNEGKSHELVTKDSSIKSLTYMTYDDG